MRRIAVFASGAGTNAQKIIEHFRVSEVGRVVLIVCNRPEAGVMTVAREAGVPSLVIEKERFFRGDAYLPELNGAGIDFLVLAGFLWKVPLPLISAYPDKIVNIHPALLPKYGGKGMYGSRVHEAVVANGDAQSGITIHLVNEVYDEGRIVFQESCAVTPDDDPQTLADKIHVLEHKHYPVVIESLLGSDSD